MSDDPDQPTEDVETTPAFDMSIYDKLEEAFDKKLAGINEGSSDKELNMTTPHDGGKVNDDVKVLVAKSKESSAAYYKEMLAIGKAGMALILSAKG